MSAFLYLSQVSEPVTSIESDVSWMKIIMVAIPNIAFVAVAFVQATRQNRRVEQKLEAKIGEPNGSGPLIDQISKMSDQQLKIFTTISDMKLRLADHTQTEMDYRENLDRKIDRLGDRLDDQAKRIDRIDNVIKSQKIEGASK